MNTLFSITKHAKRRLIISSVLSQTIRFFMYLGILGSLLAISDRISTDSYVNWMYVSYAIGSIFIAWMAFAWISDTRTNIEVATEIDQKLQLRDRVSSAIACQEKESPFAETVIDDAIAVVKKNNVKSKIGSAFPIKIPSEISWVLFIALIICCVIISPQWNLFGNQTPKNPNAVAITSTTQVEETIDALIEQIKEEESLSSSLDQELEDLAALSNLDSNDAESLRHEALRQMTDLQKQLDQMLQSEEALSFAEMSKRLKQLELPDKSETLPFVAALKNGDFDKAKKEFDKLQEKLKSETLTEEEKEELKKSLEELANQLQQLADANDALASAMSAAGLKGDLADDPEAAKKAIENAKNLNEEQKKQLLELLKTSNSACKMCKNLASQCQNGSVGGNGAGEIEQLQAMKMFKTKAELARQACRNAGNKMCQGQGVTGGQGKGNGGMNRLAETETDFVAERSPVQTGEGTIIARQLFHGGLLTTGDSQSEVRETVLAERERAERAINDEEVPRRYHELLRHYFGQLEKLTESKSDEEVEKDSEISQ